MKVEQISGSIIFEVFFFVAMVTLGVLMEGGMEADDEAEEWSSDMGISLPVFEPSLIKMYAGYLVLNRVSILSCCWCFRWNTVLS